MKYCGKCGGQIDDHARFCEHCGAPVDDWTSGYEETEDQSEPGIGAYDREDTRQKAAGGYREPPRKKSNRPLIILLIILVAALAVVCGVLLMHLRKGDQPAAQKSDTADKKTEEAAQTAKAEELLWEEEFRPICVE